MVVPRRRRQYRMTVPARRPVVTNLVGIMMLCCFRSGYWLQNICHIDDTGREHNHIVMNYGCAFAFSSTITTPTRTTTAGPSRTTIPRSSISSSIMMAVPISANILESQPLMERLVMASSLSYLSMESDNKNNNNNNNNNNDDNDTLSSTPMSRSPYLSKSGLTPLFQVVDSVSESGATVFRWEWQPVLSEDEKEEEKNNNSIVIIIVACRGSATPINFSTNLKFDLVPVNPQRMMMMTAMTSSSQPLDGPKSDTPQESTLLIHQGFQDASIGLWDVLQPQLHQILCTDRNTDVVNEKRRSRNVQHHLIFTGHSLGAATATLCGYQYASERIRTTTTSTSSTTSTTTMEQQESGIESLSLPPIYGIVTFGGPRLVNSGMARYIRRVLMMHHHMSCVNDESATGTTTTQTTPSYSSSSSSMTGCYNLIHSYDPIIQQNQPLWDALQFEVIGEERVCEPRQHTIYGTNQLRQDVLPWNFIDHCWYLGTFVGPRIVVS